MTPRASETARRSLAGTSSRLVRALLRAAAWAFAASVLAGLVLRPLAGDRVLVGRYTGYLMPWLVAGLVPGALWAWLTRQRALSAVLAACAATIVAIHVPLLSRPRERVASPSGERVTVMSFNTFSGNTDARRIARVVLGQKPDILLLQEIPPAVFESLMESLRDLYDGAPVHRAYEPGIMQGVVSRHPVEPRESLKDKGQAQHVLVRLPSSPVSVFNVHPLRTRGWSNRFRQIASLLAEDVARERAPVILGGDFNAPDHSQLYGLVAQHLVNAHREAGSGFGFTYPASAAGTWGPLPVPPLVRIDHIFHSDHFVALRAGTLEESGGSDHRPVFAELALR